MPTITYEELLQYAGEIKENRLPASNTAHLVGGELEQIVFKLRAVEQALDENKADKDLANVPVGSVSIDLLSDSLKDHILPLYSGYMFMYAIGEHPAQLTQVANLLSGIKSRVYFLIQYLRDDMRFVSDDGSIDYTYTPAHTDRLVFLFHDYTKDEGHTLRFVESNIPLADSIPVSALLEAVRKAEEATSAAQKAAADAEKAAAEVGPVVFDLTGTSPKELFALVEEHVSSSRELLGYHIADRTLYRVTPSYNPVQVSLSYMAGMQLRRIVITKTVSASGDTYAAEYYENDYIY